MKTRQAVISLTCVIFVSFSALGGERTPSGEGGSAMFLTEQDIMGVIGQVHAKFGAKDKKRFETGVRQVARLWTQADGNAADFARFCTSQFVQGPALDALFARFEHKLEMLGGYFTALMLQLRLEMDEDLGPMMAVDQLFAAYNPAAHLTDDLFKNKLAFVALLNFPVYELEDLLRQGANWSRRQWAEARLTKGFAHRVPAEVYQKLSEVDTAADNYIYNYNIHMDHLVDKAGKPIFRKGLRLISHWGLRDELKAQYSDPAKNLPKQETIQTVMLRIVNQEIPAAVIDNPKVNWDPEANTVDGKPSEREPDVRFRHLLETFRVRRLMDPYYPTMPTHIDRRFNSYREIPEKEFVGLLESVLEAPVSKKVARLIEKRLGRKLQPFDVWYDGFKARAELDESKLDKIVSEQFPDADAFDRALPDILGKLGFDKQTATFLADHIEVDAARGAGHAWGPEMRTEKAHLRTRVPKGGMNYKGFNIAMHELGHNVEQVFSLYRVDNTLLSGVPNTAFTEGFAFVFQARDLEVLGLAQTDKKRQALEVLDTFWATREIAGVGLVDIRVWHWLYEHPEATPAQLREAVVSIAKEVWNQHYAELFGVKDSPLLAIYSHMINGALYLPDYPLGHIIAFQVEDYFKSHKLAKEMERMCALGNILPNLWMKKAVGSAIASRPLILAADKALKLVK